MKRTLLLSLLLSILLPSCQVGRFIIYNFADIRDYKKFPSRPLHASNTPFYFHTTAHGRKPKNVTLPGGESVGFADYLKRNKTVAFLIIQHDTIQYEEYFRGYDKKSIVPSFSMAKSITSILIGCAIDDGLIKSVEEPVTNYIPELHGRGFENITIREVLQMTSGIKFNESYFNPFGDAASFYYGRRLRRKIAHMKTERNPGLHFAYASGNTQLLGLILDRALKGKTVTQYLQERLWTPLGMEYDASWSIDKKKNGLEKTFCCVNARAADFAKVGRLYLHGGRWNGKDIVSNKWVRESVKVDTTNASPWYYEYQWWLPSRSGDFMAQGILGQYIYVNPDKDLIIVRLGKKEGKADWWSIFRNLAAGY